MGFIIFLALASGNSALAVLGSDIQAIPKEAQALHSKILTVQTSNYLRHELTHQGTRIREFSGHDGKVFAVAWQGNSNPDLRNLLGIYFPEFQKAFAEAKRTSHHNAVMQVESKNLHIELGGHMMALYGQVSIVAKLPEGTELHDLE